MAKAPHKQVEAMASKMGTSPTKGTGFAGMLKGTVDRAADFAVDLGASYTKLGSSALNLLIGSLSMVFDGHVFPDFDAADVRAGMQKPNTRELSVLVYGHYAKKTKKVLGVKFSRYKRDGGHVVAVNGYVGNKLAINDPWYASYHTYEPYRMKLFKKWNDIHIVPGSLGKGVSILYSEPQNNYYGIIDARYVLNVPRR